MNEHSLIEGSSARPVGVTVIAGGLLLLGGVALMVAVIVLVIPVGTPDPKCNGMFCNFDWHGFFSFFAWWLALLSAWPLATGVGLLRRSRWAGYSAIALSIVAFVLGIYAARHSFSAALSLALIFLSPLSAWFFARGETRAWFLQGVHGSDQAAG